MTHEEAIKELEYEYNHLCVEYDITETCVETQAYKMAIQALKDSRNQYEKGYHDAKQKYKRALDKLAEFLESLQIEVPCDCLAPISDECEICHYNAPTKECWIKWAEKETEDDNN